MGFGYNLEQGVGDKFTKLSNIGFSMDRFTADYLEFFTERRQNLAIGWAAGYSSSNPSILEISLKFPNFLRFSVLSRSTTREATPVVTLW